MHIKSKVYAEHTIAKRQSFGCGSCNSQTRFSGSYFNT